MIYQLYAVKDRSVEAYQPITCCRAEGEALRGFIDAINNPQNGALYKHPDDFDLYHLGEYDDQTGEIRSVTPRKCGDGKALRQQGE